MKPNIQISSDRFPIMGWHHTYSAH